jgi:putative ABC transport system permease protein
MMNALWQDLRYGARMLVKRPGFTLIAIFTLALGIGANTAIFSVVNAVLLRALPYHEPDRLVRLWESNPAANLRAFSASFPNFTDWRNQNRVFEQMAAYREDGFNLTGGTEPERVIGARVTAGFFPALGVAPRAGRMFLPGEDQPGGDRAMIVSYGMWQRRFGGRPNLIGQQLSLDGQSFTVVGVMPPGFTFPQDDIEVWTPYALDPQQEDRGTHFLRVIARLRPEVTLEQARLEMDTIASRLQQAYPQLNTGWGVFMLPLHEAISGQVRATMLILLGAVGFVLLIACANVANLLLARAAARGTEIAVRAALGAGRGRILRQLLTESLLLALLGGGIGLLLAVWGIDLLVSFGPQNIPRLKEIGIDGRVLGFTLSLSLLTGAIFGLAPALNPSRIDFTQALKEGGRTSTGGLARHHLGRLLLVSETALAMVLLVGAGLLVQNFIRLQRVNPGFDPAHGLTMQINLSQSKDPKQRASFLQQALERIETLPGVQVAGAAHRLPLRGNSGIGFSIEGRPAPPPGQDISINYRSITPGYFRALGMPIIRGRTFSEQEAWGTGGAIVINQAAARRYWSNEDPIGRRVHLGRQDSGLTVVGVVGDVRESGLQLEPEPGIYVPYAHFPMPSLTLVIRAAADPLGIVSDVRRQIRAVDPDQAVSQIVTLEQLVGTAMAQPRFNASLLFLFAAVALVLAAVGIYGVMAHVVGQRTREIGLRLALGAQTADVLRLILGQGMTPALTGVLIGLGGGLALTRLIENLLFGVSATDPLTFTMIGLLLAVVALLACYVPARKATKIDPMVALRYE